MIHIFDSFNRLCLDFRDKNLLGERQRLSTKSRRQQLVDKIVGHFEISQKNYTTSQSLLFPTCYHIFLREDDFRFHYQALSTTAQDVNKIIAGRIVELRKRYPDYIPHSRHFQYQFIRLRKDDLIDKELISEPANWDEDDMTIITSTIYAPANQNDYAPGAMTVHVKDTVSFKELDVNLAALRNLEARGNTDFRFKFCSGDDTGSSVNEKPVAMFRIENSHFIIDGQRCRTYAMHTDILLVSGRVGSPESNGQEIARIDNDGVLNPHLIISGNKGNYEILANGDTFLNEVSLPAFQDNWTPLPNNSTLLLNGEIQLRFKIQ